MLLQYPWTSHQEVPHSVLCSYFPHCLLCPSFLPCLSPSSEGDEDLHQSSSVDGFRRRRAQWSHPDPGTVRGRLQRRRLDPPALRQVSERTECYSKDQHDSPTAERCTGNEHVKPIVPLLKVRMLYSFCPVDGLINIWSFIHSEPSL